jgi:hypothetical protein
VTLDPLGSNIHGIWASHKVPYGKVFRQWDTLGRLWCWCNRGEIADLPRGPQPNVFNMNRTVFDFSSVPIYNVEPPR